MEHGIRNPTNCGPAPWGHLAARTRPRDATPGVPPTPIRACPQGLPLTSAAPRWACGPPSLLRVSGLWAPSPWEPQPPLAAGGWAGCPGRTSLAWTGSLDPTGACGSVSAVGTWSRVPHRGRTEAQSHPPTVTQEGGRAATHMQTQGFMAPQKARLWTDPSPLSSSDGPECHWPILGGPWKLSCPSPRICSDAPRSCLGSGPTWGSALCLLH